MKKRLSILILILIGNYQNIFAKEKLCIIHFNHKKSINSLERKINADSNHNEYDKNKFKCFKIGLEHDQNKRPIKNAPIYACCKEQ